MNPKIILLPLMLIFHQQAFADAVLSGQGGLINLTADDVTVDARVEMQINGTMSYQDANMPWSGTGPDGIKRKISTVAYSFDGELIGSYRSNIGSCSNRHVWVGWTVVKPGLGAVIHPDSGALYGNGLTPSAAVQSLYNVDGEASNYTYPFRQQGTPGYVFVTDGPAGMYSSSNIPQAGSLTSVYVFHSGDKPVAYGYMDTYGSGCDGWIAGIQTPEIDTPPIINPDPDTACNFELSHDVLDLGNVNQQTAQTATAKVDIIGLCNGDSSVQLKSVPGEMTMGGLTIQLRFDSGTSEKTNWKLQMDVTARTPFTASVSSVGTLETGEFERSGVINIVYD